VIRSDVVVDSQRSPRHPSTPRLGTAQNQLSATHAAPPATPRLVIATVRNDTRSLELSRPVAVAVVDSRSNPSLRRCRGNPLFPTTRAPTLPLRTLRAACAPIPPRHPGLLGLPTLRPPPSPSHPHSRPLSTPLGFGYPYPLDSGGLYHSSGSAGHHHHHPHHPSRPSRSKARANPKPLLATK
jgi:hypothetical protein